MSTNRSEHPKSSTAACNLTQGRRRDQVEHSSNTASFCFAAMIAMIALSALLGGCDLQPPPKLAVTSEIPNVKPLIAKAEWRGWVQDAVDCLHRAPAVPFDSLAWYEASAGIPNTVEPAAPGGKWECWAGMSYVSDRKVVLSPSCSGESKTTVVHEALHVMYKSPSVLLNTREWWHDPRVFSRSCGVVV